MKKRKPKIPKKMTAMLIFFTKNIRKNIPITQTKKYVNS